MSHQLNPNTCPKCAAPIPAEAPQGLCPKCVLAGAAMIADPGGSATATGEIPSLERVVAAFPQLEILELIGRGGMGFVFQARQPHLDRFVALKLLPDKLARDAQFAERFHREGRVLARLNHPGIVSVHDFGVTGGFCFLLMEFVDGVNLRQAMQAGRFSPAAALSVVPKICEALQYAHEQGILHRDIKPENILLDTRGRVKIADFGIAKLVGETPREATLTGTGTALGTPHYMAPEQLEKPSEVDHRADIYSLGVVFYEMLTGELPIGRFAAPSRLTPMDSRVDDIVFRTLEKEPARRFQSAGAVQTEVQTLADQARAAAAQPDLSPEQDFILCNPRLPRLAQAITVYALVVLPALFLMSSFAWLKSINEQTLAFEILLFEALGKGLELITFVVMVIGGFKLRGLRPSGPGLLRGTIWSRIVLLVVGIPIGLVILARVGADGARPIAALEIFEATLSYLAVGFEIAALVWLRRSRVALDTLCAQAGNASGSHGTRVVNAPTAESSRVSRKAISGAALVVLSLPFPFLLLGAVLTGWSGLGSGEWVLGAAAVLLLGVPGAILGCLALGDIRAGHGRVRGLPLAVFAALTWPVLVVVGSAISVSLFTLYFSVQAGAGARNVLAPVSALLLPVGTLVFALWAIHATVRWASGQSAAPRRGVLKWIFVGLLVAGMGFVLSIPARRVQRGPSAGRDQRRTSTDSPVPTKAISFSRFYVQARAVMATTDTPLGPDDAIVPWLEHPDGRGVQGQIIDNSNRENGRSQTSKTFAWSLPEELEGNQIAEIQAHLRDLLARQPMEFTSGTPVYAFTVTNRFGARLRGCLEYQESFLADAFRATDPDHPLRARIRILGAAPVRSTLSGVVVQLEPAIPPGHVLEPVAMGALGMEERASKSTSQAPGSKAFSCSWILPPSFAFEEAQEAARQCERLLREGLLSLPSGERRLLFAITNHVGEVHQGFLELVKPHPASP